MSNLNLTVREGDRVELRYNGVRLGDIYMRDAGTRRRGSAMVGFHLVPEVEVIRGKLADRGVTIIRRTKDPFR